MMSTEEKPRSTRYWVLIGDRRVGPYPLSQIILMRRQGKLESPVQLLEEGATRPFRCANW